MRRALTLLAIALWATVSLSAADLRLLVTGDVRWDPEIGRHLEGLLAQDGMTVRIDLAKDLPDGTERLRADSFDALVLGQDVLAERAAGRFLRMIRRRQKDARIFLHQDWAYAVDYFKEPCIEPAFAEYGYDQRRMYEALTERSRTAASRYDLSLLPVGTAVQNVRATFERDNLTRDGVRLNHSIGCYLAACTWYEALTGRDVRDNAYDPGRISPERASLARGASHVALLDPERVTDFGFRKLNTNYDETKVPAYTLPDPLRMQDGSGRV